VDIRAKPDLTPVINRSGLLTSDGAAVSSEGAGEVVAEAPRHKRDMADRFAGLVSPDPSVHSGRRIPGYSKGVDIEWQRYHGWSLPSS
jgi:hypothetical protein